MPGTIIPSRHCNARSHHTNIRRAGNEMDQGIQPLVVMLSAIWPQKQPRWSEEYRLLCKWWEASITETCLSLLFLSTALMVVAASLGWFEAKSFGNTDQSLCRSSRETKYSGGNCGVVYEVAGFRGKKELTINLFDPHKAVICTSAYTHAHEARCSKTISRSYIASHEHREHPDRSRSRQSLPDLIFWLL